jgi:hypothetical protein
MNLFLIVTNTVTSQNITFSLESLYICEEFFNNDIAQETVDEINFYAQKLKNSQSNIFSRLPRIYKRQPMTAEKICI